MSVGERRALDRVGVDLLVLDEVRRDRVADVDVLGGDENRLGDLLRATASSRWFSRITMATKARTASRTPTRMTRRFDRFTNIPL